MQTKLIVLQPTSLCNLNCIYCYLPNRLDSSKMKEGPLERVFELSLSSQLVQDEIEFLWHAGEPLTAGIPFFQRAVALIERHNHRAIRVLNNIQTNATLIDDDWGQFLSEYNFSVGVSLDGPAELHDKQRSRWSGAGSHRAAMHGVNILRRYGINPGVICVLTRDSLEHPDEIFNFFLTNGFRSLGFNVEEIENVHYVSSLQKADASSAYQRFMERLFELWWPHRRDLVIREFDDFGHVFASYAHDPSWFRPVLDTEPLGIVTIQHNGDVSTFSPELAGRVSAEFGGFVIGNIWTLKSFDDLAESAQFKRIAEEAAISVNLCRASCGFFPVCGGEFLSNKFSEHGTLRATETNTCKLHRQTLATILLDKLSQSSPGLGQDWGV